MKTVLMTLIVLMAIQANAQNGSSSAQQSDGCEGAMYFPDQTQNPVRAGEALLQV